MAPDRTDTQPSCRLFVGAGGYSFPEWVDARFYPPGTANRDMLSCYSRQSSAIEINHARQRVPDAAAMARMLPRAPEGFLFTAEPNRALTPEIDPKNRSRPLEAGWSGAAVF